MVCVWMSGLGSFANFMLFIPFMAATRPWDGQGYHLSKCLIFRGWLWKEGANNCPASSDVTKR